MSIPPRHPYSGGRPSGRSPERVSGRPALPSEAPAILAGIVDALSAPEVADELAGLTRVRAAYTTLHSAQRRRAGTPARPPARRSTLRHRAIGTTLAAGILGLGGFGAVAYAGALPAAAQQVAHHLIGAPKGHLGRASGLRPPAAGALPTSTRSAAPAGTRTGAPAATRTPTPARPGATGAVATAPASPDPTGAAAFGRCSAYSHAEDRAAANSVAFANLAAAAGGTDRIAGYCAAIAQPGSATVSQPAGSPSAVPSDRSTGGPGTAPSHPAALPSTVPSHSRPAGKPGAPPSHPVTPPSPSHPTGKPGVVPPGSTKRPGGH